jgi:VWFA-related protein
MKKGNSLLSLVLTLGGVFCLLVTGASQAAVLRKKQDSQKRNQGPGKPVTIPVGLRIRGTKPLPEVQALDLNVVEDGDPQLTLSIRSIGNNSPMTIAVLIQDDLVSSVANEAKPIAEFIRHLPKGSRVMVGYLRSGSLNVRQKFSSDLEKAANSIRAPMGLASAAPYNPYVEVIEALNRFESQPAGRRAILLVSDGLDTSRGVDSSTPGQSLDLQRAINRAQQRSVAIYSFYAPSVALESSGNQILIGNAQSSLEKLSHETGGRAFFQGTGAPVSFDPFLRDMSESLNYQLAVTYLSTHTNKGFHRLQIRSLTPGVELSYPAGYVK